MLTFLFNRYNVRLPGLAEDVKRLLPMGIGLSASFPDGLKKTLSKDVPVLLYDTELALDTADDDAARTAAADAGALSSPRALCSVGRVCDTFASEAAFVSRLAAWKEFFAAEGVTLLITNRRPFDPDKSVSSAKLTRLSLASGVRIAFDVGTSHACGHVMEQWFDWREQTDLLLLNDNFGRGALAPVGSGSYDPSVAPDDMRQPGYGSAPFPGLMAEVRKTHPALPLFINGGRFQNLPIGEVLTETASMLGGRVPVSPAGGRVGHRDNGRMMI